jgi:hypothetical protein
MSRPCGKLSERRPCGKLSELEDEGGMNENVEVEKKR